MSFGENLQEVRRKNRLSQEELAEMLGVSRQAVSKWELGEGYPEVEKLLVLARRLNLSLDRLLDNEAAGKLSEDLLVLSPNKANLLSCRGGVKVDGCTIEVMSNKEGWITLCWYKTGKEAMDAMERIREALLQGQAYLEL